MFNMPRSRSRRKATDTQIYGYMAVWKDTIGAADCFYYLVTKEALYVAARSSLDIIARGYLKE